MESSLMTSLSTNYRPSPTIEQLLNSRPSSMMMNDNQLPILLYIRNYNEYRRHRPAEARLAARRRERAEAREIRLREIERQQKEMDEHSDKHYELLNNNGNVSGINNQIQNINNNNNNMDHIGSSYRMRTPIISRESRTSSYTSSRRSSQESLDMMCGGTNDSPRELRHYAQELEEKFRKAMINNAQLDNEKQSYVYQIDLFKDEMEELEENYLRLQRDFKEKSRNYEQLKRDNERLQFDFKCYKEALEERERLIKEADLVIIRNNGNQNAKIFHKNKLLLQNGHPNGENHSMINGDVNNDNNDDDEDFPVLLANNLSLISKDASLILEDIPGKTLENKLKNLMLEHRQLQNQINELKNELDDERNRACSMNEAFGNNSLHLTTEMQAEIQREANKMTNDLRYKLKKCEQENATLISTVNRLENQLIRCKADADQSERLEEELKLDKRKAQRELREALTKIEELESANVHLQKRIDKLKSNRNIIGIIANGGSNNNNNGSNITDQTTTPQPSTTESSSSCASSDISSTLCSSSSTTTND
ncbi:Leucine-rich repeat flightless-interacting protein [Dermatophagoides pteronyssinus]|uniref:Leucine-rich repeat flightless-interacting protein n=1 Tax=Dermatophagoides pteronyssinus TaxID=6956 RepID=A0ABQ8JNM6_DERPT|nr:Leucine-rich repeat flightless-interacting protein [Dermatophagoides pteronyssinus]